MLTLRSPQVVGQELIKISETNRLARGKSFDPKMREYEIQSPDGIIKLPESKIAKEFTAQEELDFYRSEKNSN